MSIYEYLDNIYTMGGIEAQEEKAAWLWALYRINTEIFEAYAAEHGIDLTAHTTNAPESDFALWRRDMEG